MANANLCMFVYACTYIGIRIEQKIRNVYVRSLHSRAKLTMTERQTERQRERQQ
jgi:hypothetical protein